ncbi:MAG: CDP-diacylglycerol--serine O-phosphatidyltransferase [Desulfovibrionaceae bacterium]|jgi:CDP-diacylglycerol---serine O-phosphatidyltransferase|nr:CDP-diacylglycerol--serine O-phosphatidyltransferase [Desulfovibrionaceae bacterium]
MKDEKLPIHKGVYILPNMITTISLFSGVMGVIYAMDGRFELAALAIIFSGLMDGLDGKVARLTHTASEFGVQYDSLADCVAFGVSPALIMWLWHLHTFGRLGCAAVFIYAACGALRLARFNISTASTSKRFFVGLPIPGAACTAISLILIESYLPQFVQPAMPYFALVMTAVLGILMVSRVRYFSFKEYDFVRAHPFSTMVTAMLIFALIITAPKIFAFLLCFGYIIGGLVYTFMILPRRNRELLRNLSLSGE